MVSFLPPLCLFIDTKICKPVLLYEWGYVEFQVKSGIGEIEDLSAQTDYVFDLADDSENHQLMGAILCQSLHM